MRAPAGDFMERFRQGLEEEMDGRWLTSPMAEWMDAHHAEAAKLLGHQHMNWDKAAAALGAHGLSDRAGEPPTAETARETWKRVEARQRAGMKLRGN